MNPPPSHPGPLRLTATLCLAEVLTMLGVFAFPALLPGFEDQWALSKTQSGWIAGIYFAGYTLAVPVLVALTDRIDARRIYLAGAGVALVASAGFALLAEGFWTALLFRFLAGVALAGTYMPGLRVLVDRYEGPRQSRAMAFYTSSFSLGTAASFFVAGWASGLLGWPGAFGLSALGAALSIALIWGLSPYQPTPADDAKRLLDLRPVFANRRAMAFVLGYGIHCWELFALRSWMVALLAFGAAAGGGVAIGLPTTIAGISGVLAMAASILGQEAAARFGPFRTITLAMIASSALAAVVGFASAWSYEVLALLLLAYSMAVQLDSAALTAGAVASAEPGRRGATMAVHSLIGFGGAALGPVVLGLVLDATGGGGVASSWGWAFASIAGVGLLGPLALWVLGRSPIKS